MAKGNSHSCGCISAVIVLVVIVVVAAFLIGSRFITMENLDSWGVHIVDQEGLLSQFDSEHFTNEDTLRSQGMASWKVWDVMMWIIKSGDYQPE